LPTTDSAAPTTGSSISSAGILKITKQSLARVLRQLVEKDFIEQRQGTQDRRHRLLFLTDKGAELERRLTEDQRQRIARAYREAGAQAVAGYRRVLTGMVDDEDRDRLRRPRGG
jgi:DNA-binding MarR family transcriptional regulator